MKTKFRFRLLVQAAVAAFFMTTASCDSGCGSHFHAGECHENLMAQHQMSKEHLDCLVSKYTDGKGISWNDFGIVEGKDCEASVKVEITNGKLSVSVPEGHDAIAYYQVGLFQQILKYHPKAFVFYPIKQANEDGDNIFEVIGADNDIPYTCFDLSAPPKPNATYPDCTSTAANKYKQSDSCKECPASLGSTRQYHCKCKADFDRYPKQDSLYVEANCVDSFMKENKIAMDDSVCITENFYFGVIKRNGKKHVIYPAQLFADILSSDKPESFMFYRAETNGKSDIIFTVLKGGAVIGRYDLSQPPVKANDCNGKLITSYRKKHH